MRHYIISYEVNKVDQNTNAFKEAIKNLGHWVKIHKTAWFVTTDKTAEQTRECLDKYIDPNDLVFVVEVTKEAGFSCRLHPQVNKFILDARAE